MMIVVHLVCLTVHLNKDDNLQLSKCHIHYDDDDHCLHFEPYYPFIARSLEWVCPSCGVANRTALPEGSEEEARDTKITKEMEDIVCN